MGKNLSKQNLSPAEIEGKVAFAYFRDRISDWFETIGTNKADAYSTFASAIAKPGDWFVSFNYDICLEKTLQQEGIWSLKDGYGFSIPGFHKSSETTLIKVHGSVNWTMPLRSGNPDRPVITSEHCRMLGYANHSDESIQEPFFGAGPLLAVPTSGKKFYISTSFGPRFEDFWDHLWSLTRERLLESDEVIICGYSLPLADRLAREIIFSSIDKNAKIEIVCGSSGLTIAQEFQESGFTQVTVAQAGHFEEWVASNWSGERKHA
jgi:hypothetical protein